MSHNFNLSAEHDIILDGNRLSRVEGVDYIAQLAKCRLITLLTEWDLDTTVGIDWFNILGRNYDLALIQGIVTQKLSDTDGVTSVENVDINKSGRTLTITFTAIADGQVFTEVVSI